MYLNAIVETAHWIGDSESLGVDSPSSVDQVLVLMEALAECKEGVEVGLSGLEQTHGHGFLPLPLGPVAHHADLVDLLVGGRVPVEVDGFGGAGAVMGVAAFAALIEIVHSNIDTSHPYLA
jgi:hypothetical protein